MDTKKEYPKPPENVKVLANGAGYDMVKKRISHKPGTFGDAPNQVEGKDLVKTRWDNTRQEIERAIIEQAKRQNGNVLTGSQAIGHAAGLLYSQVLDGKGTLRDRNKVLWDIARYGGMVRDKNDAPAQINNTQINVSIDALRSILDRTGGNILDV